MNYIFTDAALDGYCGPRGGCGPSQRGQRRFPSLSSGGGGGGAADRKQGGSGEQTEVNTITFYGHPRWHRTPPLPPPPTEPPSPPAPSQQTVRRLHHEPVTFSFSISLHLTISSSTPCISCTISRTRQADAHDSESQFKCDYTSWRGPLRIFFFFSQNPETCKQTQSKGKKIFNSENKTKK